MVAGEIDGKLNLLQKLIESLVCPAAFKLTRLKLFGMKQNIFYSANEWVLVEIMKFINLQMFSEMIYVLEN